MFKNKKLLLQKIKLLSDTRVLGLLAFGVIALLVTWSGVKTVQTNYELEKKISVAKQRNEVERLENENLKLKDTYYQTNQYLELSARRQLGKAAPGEKLFIVPKQVALSKTVEVAAAQNTPKKDEIQDKSRYQRNLDAWMKFLFR